jgi:hypothetical protein
MPDRNKIASEVVRLEDDLLAYSQRIAQIKSADSFSNWIIDVLDRDQLLARQLRLPCDSPARKALLTLLSTSSELNHPLTVLLAQRTSAFIATIRDVYRHPLRGHRLDSLSDNLQTLTQLLHRYQTNYEHKKTIRLVAHALRDHRLHLFKTNPNEPDLRVILRAFYEDPNRDELEAKSELLEFTLDQLSKDARKARQIFQPRHIWWGVATIFKEATPAWAHERRQALNLVIRSNLGETDYAPRKDLDFSSIVPELHSPENEEMWVAINAIGTYLSPLASVISRSNVARLSAKISQDIDYFLKRPPVASDLKLLQSRLMLFYEAARYDSFRASLRLAMASTFKLAERRIGRYYFAAEVTQRASAVIRRLSELAAKPKLWTKPTISSLLVSGAAGQGKSELVLQLVDELKEALTLPLHHEFFSVGRDITTTEELNKALDEIVACAHPFQCYAFDEFDKAQFDFYGPFLPLLEFESPQKRIFIFSQSTAPAFEDLKQLAEGRQSKTMRDFLTRMQLGGLDIPHLKYCPEQRLLTTIGMARSREGEFEGIERETAFSLLNRSELLNNRQILTVASSELTVTQSILSLKQKEGVLGRRPEFRPRAQPWVRVQW